ncbi:hypothetical protein FB99_36990 [Pantoea agglomerans]|nr:hypothetical protein FB99_36990 [Pantoea agglomerans]
MSACWWCWLSASLSLSDKAKKAESAAACCKNNGLLLPDFSNPYG